jgi:LysR family cyn operon transcriptional activator
VELRHLQYLLTVAEEGSFTRASEKLYVTQPALSQQVRQLEDELGTTLFDRTSKGIRLTVAGELFSQYARKVFCQLDEAKNALQELEGLQRGSLVIGTVQTVNAYLIPQVVAQFANNYPAISLRIEELTADEVENRVEDGSVQVGLSFGPITNTNLEFDELFEEELVLVVSKEHDLAGSEVIPLSDLDNFPLVMLSKGYCTRRLWDYCAQQVGIQSRIIAEMNTISAILRAIEPTKTGTILPRLALDSALAANLTGINLSQPTPAHPVGLVWRRGSYRAAAARLFAQIIKENFQI